MGSVRSVLNFSFSLSIYYSYIWVQFQIIGDCVWEYNWIVFELHAMQKLEREYTFSENGFRIHFVSFHFASNRFLLLFFFCPTWAETIGDNIVWAQNDDNDFMLEYQFNVRLKTNFKSLVPQFFVFFVFVYSFRFCADVHIAILSELSISEMILNWNVYRRYF